VLGYQNTKSTEFHILGSQAYSRYLEQTITQSQPDQHVNPALTGSPSKFACLVEKVRRGHPAGLEELYGLAKNFNYFLMRQLG
jgi:hypothetical protein